MGKSIADRKGLKVPVTEVKVLIQKLGWNQVTIAKYLGYSSKTSVSSMLHREFVAQSIRDKLAEALKNPTQATQNLPVIVSEPKPRRELKHRNSVVRFTILSTPSEAAAVRALLAAVGYQFQQEEGE